MTVAATDQPPKFHAGDGSSSIFAFPFRILDSADLIVILFSDDGMTTLTETTHYTVAGVDAVDGGTVTMVAGSIPAVGETLMLSTAPAIEQPTELPAAGYINLPAIERMVDRQALQIQNHVMERLSRIPALRFATQNALRNLELPSPDSLTLLSGGRKVFGYNAEDDGIELIEMVDGASTPVNAIAQVSRSARAALPSGASLATLGQVTDEDLGLWIKLTAGWAPVGHRIISPEMFGAMGDRINDDTGPINDCLEYAAAHKYGVLATGMYRHTAPIVFPTGTYGFSHAEFTTFAPTPCSGFFYDGPPEAVAVEILQVKGCMFGSLMCYNLGVPPNGAQPLIEGVTGILWHSTVAGGTANNNIFQRLGIFGFYIGLQIGDYTGDGYDSNTEDTNFGVIHMLGVQNPLIIDSDGLDLNYIDTFRNGPPKVFADTGHLREHIIHIKRMGGGWRFGNVFLRADGMPDEGSIIKMEDGHLEMMQLRIEGTNTDEFTPELKCRTLDFESTGGNYSTTFHNLFVAKHIKDSAGLCIKSTGTGALHFYDSSFSGDVSASHENVELTNCYFWEKSAASGTYHTVVGSGFIARRGIKRKVYTTGAVIDDYLGGYETLDVLTATTANIPVAKLQTVQLGNLVGELSGATNPTAIVHNTALTLATYVLTSDGDSIAVTFDYHLYRGPGPQNFDAWGEVRYSACLNNAGTVLTGVAGGFDITDAATLLRTAVAYSGADYSALIVTPTITVAGSGPYTVSFKLTQFNTHDAVQHTNARLGYKVTYMNSNGIGALLNTADFTNSFPIVV